MPVVVPIPTRRIIDWDSFHEVFASSLRFPDYYGRNEDAFQDLLWYPEAEDVGVAVEQGDALVLLLQERGEEFTARCPVQFGFLQRTIAVINADRIEHGGNGVPLALAYR